MSQDDEPRFARRVTSVVAGVRYVGLYAIEGRTLTVRSSKMQLSAALPEDGTAPQHLARHLLRLMAPMNRGPRADL